MLMNMFFLYVSLSLSIWKFVYYYKPGNEGYDWIKDEFIALRNLYSFEPNIRFSRRNCGTSQCNIHGIHGVPSFYLMDTRKTFRFSGPFDLESFVDFITENTQIDPPYFEKLATRSKDDIQEYLDDEKCVVLFNIHQANGEKFRTVAHHMNMERDILFFSSSKLMIFDTSKREQATMYVKSMSFPVDLNHSSVDVEDSIKQMCLFYKKGITFKQLLNNKNETNSNVIYMHEEELGVF